MLVAGILEDVNRMKLPASGYALLLHNDGTIIAHRDANWILNPSMNFGVSTHNSHAG